MNPTNARLAVSASQMSRSLSRSLRAPGFRLPWGAWFVLLVSLPGLASAGEAMPVVSLAPEHVLQGGISTLRVEWPSPIRALRIQVGGREILTAVPADRAPTTLLVGIDLETPPGPLEVRIDAEDRTGQALKARGTLQIQAAGYPIQRLMVPKAFTDLDAATLERINREKAVLDHLWGVETPTRFWHERFRLPLDGAASGSGFGVRRIINGEPRAPHTGLDFTAAAGTPVLAVNAGMVAAVEDQFFAGKAVILDHGLGLYSMYFHLQESLVMPGQRVERGERIAFVGNTGRTTGAHLHWGVRLHGARIDPRELLKPISLE